MQVPKSTLRYNTGKKPNEAVSLISAANKNDMTFSVSGTKFTVNTSKTYYLEGADYDSDIWAFTLNNPNNIAFANAGLTIVITIPITNPPLVDNIVDGWDLWIKTELGLASSTTDPNLLNAVE